LRLRRLHCADPGDIRKQTAPLRELPAHRSKSAIEKAGTPVLRVTLSDVSLTVTVHDALKTQLIAGALTLTIFSGAAAITTGAKQSSKADDSFFISLPPDVGSIMSVIR